MQESDRSVLIIGAGMGGLGLALSLLRQNKKVIVFESAPQLAEIGAGLSLSPNATLALESLGLGAFLADAADYPNTSVLRHYKTGEVLNRNDFGVNFKDDFGAEYYQIHRADMHAGLVAAVNEYDASCIRLGHHFERADQTDTSVTAHFSNGNSETGRLLIAADGIRSSVRSTVIDEVAPEFTGQVAYRATLDGRNTRPFLEVADSNVATGPGHIVVWYPIRHGELLNVVAITQSDAWNKEGWNTPATKQEILDEHEGWNDDVLGIINSAPDNVFYKWALFDRDPLAQWCFNRIALLGDAAHPMLPFLGMGAAMAFEDAVVLGRCLDAWDHHEKAFNAYHAGRYERTTQVLNASRNHGKVLQSSDPDKVDWGNLKTDNDWSFFAYNPATVEI